MGLETGTYISDLVATNPVGATDTKGEGDDHLRLIKSTLLATFPNITGATTSSHSELNRLDGNVGGFLTDSIVAASGTDTITATFSPAITLTDKTVVMIRAAGANTSTTPTFNPNALGAKTIVKNGNQALIAGDISAAGHVLVLCYSSANDNWEFINSGLQNTSAISGYVAGKTFYISTDSSLTSLALNTTVTKATWESIGPTGSGATNIWTGLDSLPSNITAIIINSWGSVTDTAGGQQYIHVGARVTGSTTVIPYSAFKYDTAYTVAATATTFGTTQIIIPVDSSIRFDAYWDTDVDSTVQIVVDLIGFVL